METEVYAGIPLEEGHQDGPRKDAKFAFPETIVQHAEGDLIVSERGGPWLRLIDPQGAVRTQELVGRLSDTDVPLSPYGRIFLIGGLVYVSAAGRLWRADFNARAPRLLFLPGPKAQLSCFVVRDEVIVGATVPTPTARAQLIELAWGGGSNLVAELRGSGAGGMATGADGLLYVNERERILRVSPTGVVEELRPTSTPPPQLGDLWFSDSMGGMDFDGDGNLYISDTYGDVYAMAPDGKVEIAVNLPDGTTDVLVATDGHLYVPDYDNHAILRSVDPVTPKRAAK